jgi:hypothetical protein
MQVDRFCRKFERILDDCESYEKNCEPCYEGNGGEGDDFDHYDHHNHHDSHSRRDNRRDNGRNFSKKHCGSFGRNPLFVGLIVGVVIALILLFMSYSVSVR